MRMIIGYLGEIIVILSMLSLFIYFFAFTNYESYRPIYLFTLFYLLILVKPQYRRINLWLETVSTGCLIVYYMISDLLFYNGSYIYLPFTHETSTTINRFFAQNLPNAGLSAFMVLGYNGGG